MSNSEENINHKCIVEIEGISSSSRTYLIVVRCDYKINIDNTEINVIENILNDKNMIGLNLYPEFVSVSYMATVFGSREIAEKCIDRIISRDSKYKHNQYKIIEVY